MEIKQWKQRIFLFYISPLVRINTHFFKDVNHNTHFYGCCRGTIKVLAVGQSKSTLKGVCCVSSAILKNGRARHQPLRWWHKQSNTTTWVDASLSSAIAKLLTLPLESFMRKYLETNSYVYWSAPRLRIRHLQCPPNYNMWPSRASQACQGSVFHILRIATLYSKILQIINVCCFNRDVTDLQSTWQKTTRWHSGGTKGTIS